MLIPITSADSEIQEWALVELQGRVEPMHETDLQQTLQVGTLQLSKTVSYWKPSKHVLKLHCLLSSTAGGTLRPRDSSSTTASLLLWL